MSMGDWARTVVVAGAVLIGGVYVLDWIEGNTGKAAAVAGAAGAGHAAGKAATDRIGGGGGGGGGGAGGAAGRTKDKDKDEKRPAPTTSTTTKPIGNSRVVPMPVVVHSPTPSSVRMTALLKGDG